MTNAEKRSTTDGEHEVVLVNGLRVTSGAVLPECVRVKVLRNHDGNGDGAFYYKGEIVDIYAKYHKQQTKPVDENQHEWEVNPPVFELLK
jgi:excinuclease UvrABC helicase subunit UvrB